MKRVFTMFVAGAAALAGCSKADTGFGADPLGESELGKIGISIVDNITRAGNNEKIDITEIIPDWQKPDWETDLKVLLACEDRTIILDQNNSYAGYNSVKGFNQISDVNYTFTPASYTIKLVTPSASGAMYDYADTKNGETVGYGEAAYRDDGVVVKAEEGVAKPYFEGKATGVQVVKRQTATANIEVFVANSVVRFDFTDAFKGYFPKAQFTLTTESGFTAEFGYDRKSSKPVEFVQENYWINPLGIKINGSAWAQDPSPEIVDAKEVEMEVSVGRDKVLPQYRYTYTFDLESVGNTEDNGTGNHGIKITINSEPVGSNTIKNGDDDWFELNPDVNVPDND